jgi:hypothetical protein
MVGAGLTDPKSKISAEVPIALSLPTVDTDTMNKQPREER